MADFAEVAFRGDELTMFREDVGPRHATIFLCVGQTNASPMRMTLTLAGLDEAKTSGGLRPRWRGLR
jgi:hypothetical protein